MNNLCNNMLGHTVNFSNIQKLHAHARLLWRTSYVVTRSNATARWLPISMQYSRVRCWLPNFCYDYWIRRKRKR
ncbi:hypothetical protein I3843_08G128300 [Carya illinoinensis]|nr:hypothetical protein I3843_08G128300 [Carya illinoinensis]